MTELKEELKVRPGEDRARPLPQERIAQNPQPTSKTGRGLWPRPFLLGLGVSLFEDYRAPVVRAAQEIGQYLNNVVALAVAPV